MASTNKQDVASITISIDAPNVFWTKVLEIDRWRKRVLLETIVVDSDEPPVRRWYKVGHAHVQSLFIRAEHGPSEDRY